MANPYQTCQPMDLTFQICNRIYQNKMQDSVRTELRFRLGGDIRDDLELITSFFYELLTVYRHISIP